MPQKNIIIGVAIVVIIALAGAIYFTVAPRVNDERAHVPSPAAFGTPSAESPAPVPVATPPTATPSATKNGSKITTSPTMWSKVIENPSGSAASVGLYISTQKLVEATVGEPYTGFISATADPSKNFEWKVLSGALPPGLMAVHSIDCANYQGKVCQPSLQISGKPSAAGSYNFRAAVSDGKIAVYKDFTLVVKIAPNLKITTLSLPDGVLGENYTVDIAGSGGAGAYSWAVRTGFLPVGLSIITQPCTGSTVCKANAKITGKTGSAGTYTFGVVLSSGEETTSKEFTVVVK